LRELRKQLPRRRFVYLGDTARVPYGTKSPETVARYATNVANTLLNRGCGALVIACNTASAFGLEAIRRMCEVPVVDVVEPVARAVVRDGARRVLVLGTPGTVRSGAYVRALRAGDPSIQVDQCACPLFVPLAEEGWTNGELPRLAAERYLRGVLSTTDLDAVILGCTHYPLLSDVIASTVAKFSASPPTIYDCAAHTATKLRETVGDGDVEGGTEFLVSDDPIGFLRVAERFLGESIESAEHVEVG
jgi:glutamate racemase